MQTAKDYIRKNILDSAQKLFLKKGYANVSMREISLKAQVGLSNMYNYFKNKDELFCTIARPAANAMENTLLEHHGKHSSDLTDMMSEQFLRDTITEYLTILKKYKKETMLLLFCSQGSSLQNFKESFIEKSTPLVRDYLKMQKEIHKEMNVDISDFFIALHTTWMFALLEEILKQKIKDDALEKILSEYIKFEVIGWRELIEL